MADLISDLVGSWPLSVAADDLKGTRSGVVTGGTFAANAGFGQSALTLVGASSQYVTVTPSITFVGAASFGIWINLPTIGAGTYQYLLADFDGGGSTSAFRLYVGDAPGKTQTLFYGYGSRTFVADYGAMSAYEGKPTHIGVADDGSGNAQLYVNGAAITTTASGSGARPSAQASFAIGRSGLYAGNCLTGALTDLRIYSRALTAAEIQALAGVCGHRVSFPDRNHLRPRPFAPGIAR